MIIAIFVNNEWRLNKKENQVSEALVSVGLRGSMYAALPLIPLIMFLWL